MAMSIGECPSCGKNTLIVYMDEDLNRGKPYKFFHQDCYNCDYSQGMNIPYFKR